NPTRTLKRNFQDTIANAFLHSETTDDFKLSTPGFLRIHKMHENLALKQMKYSSYKSTMGRMGAGGIEGRYKKEKITNPGLVKRVLKQQNLSDNINGGFLSTDKTSNVFLNSRVRESVKTNWEQKRKFNTQMNSGSSKVSSIMQSYVPTREEQRKQNGSQNPILLEGLDKCEMSPVKDVKADANKNRKGKDNTNWNFENGENSSKIIMKREILFHKSFATGKTDAQRSNIGLYDESNVSNESRYLKTDANIISSNSTNIIPRDLFRQNHSSVSNKFSMKTKRNSLQNEATYSTLSSIDSSYISMKPNEHIAVTATSVTKPQSLNIQTPTPTPFTQLIALEEVSRTMHRNTSESEDEQNNFLGTADILTDQEKCVTTEDDIGKLQTIAQKPGSSVPDGQISDSGRIQMNCQLQVQTSLPPTELTEEKVIYFRLKYPVKLWTTLGLYDDKYLDIINSHWLSFEPPSSIIHKVFATIYGIFMVVGCGGNLLVIFMFVRCRSLRTPPNYLIANLAISDFLMNAKTPIFIINSLYQGPVMGEFGCKLYGFVGGLTGTASIMTLATIALDRYYAIVHPLNPFKRTTFTRAILMISGVWVYSGTFSSLPLFGINKYTSEGYLTSCSFDYLSDEIGSRVFVFVFFLAAWLLPLTVISFSYINIFRMVRAAEKLDIFSTGGGRSSGESFKYSFYNKLEEFCFSPFHTFCYSRQDPHKQKTEVKIALLACYIISLWILAWTPYALVALLGIFGWKQYLTPMISSIPALFCKTASCIDPFVYCINHPRFQRELRSNFKICFRFHPNRKGSHGASFYSAATCRENSDDNNQQSLRKMSTSRKKKVIIPSAVGVSTISSTFHASKIAVHNPKKPSFKATGYETKPIDLNLTDLNQPFESESFPSRTENTSLNSMENGGNKPRKYDRCNSVGNINSNNFSGRLAKMKRINGERKCSKPTLEPRDNKTTTTAEVDVHQATSLPVIMDLNKLSEEVD
ncbi:Opsin-2, partial [Orchesella cincta]